MIGTFVIYGSNLISAKTILVAAGLLIVHGRQGASQATPTVSPADPVYGFIDRLIAIGAIDSVIVGQRPMSEREILRILGNARLGFARSPMKSNSIRESLDRYDQFYRDRVGGSSGGGRLAVDRAGMDVLLADSPSRGIEKTAGLDMVLNPLLANRQGVPSVDGQTAALFAGANVSLTPWLVASTVVRGGVRKERGLSAAGDLRPEQLYARGLFRNVAVTLGRDYVYFGQGWNGSMQNSLNARALDMLRIASDRPFVVPLASRFLGPFAGTFYIADLGRTQTFPHAQLVGYKLSARPRKNFELGVTISDQMGGQGGPTGTFLQRVEDIVPLLDATIFHRTLAFSNKFAGLDARLGVPHAKGLQLYMDGALDDFDLRRLRSSLVQDGGYVWGASLDCVTECGRVRLVAEYHTTGVRYYTHGIYRSGYTLDRQIIGNPLGPLAQAGYLSMEMDRVGSRFGLTAAHEIRSGDVWGAVSTTPNDSDFRLVILEQHPAERRWRLTGSAVRGHPTDALSARVALGIERVDRFHFVEGSTRTNALLEVGLEVRPTLLGRHR